ncbi:hypothetical protein HETIRDRAFT_426127 [Heterobasidion irregulare TC 32-1]|uniref:Uncharacterized protein n=1 Tax=Heterobasidion irregulare (strain TC 32-1) TaxID=747525 RepID=W4K9C9_HETIT|nr:uncharacterized protein HETIRDRAFT_426127 [Heterobasidion irregulare TC 32-1]ETW82442.1 hypothetical protein HETIRDRAFT_426127 [Heterobasidion irregulare TC 32-1]
MAFQCLACPRNFHNQRTLKTHQWNCKGYQEIQDITFQQKRAREEEAVEEAKTRSRKRAQVSVEPEELTAEFPKRFDDFLPGSTTPLSHIPSKQHPLPTQSDTESVPPPPAPPEPVPVPVPVLDPVFDTKPNKFGLFCRYKRRLTHDPEPENSLDKRNQHQHSVAFIPEDYPAMFSFLDPEQIIRGVHLIPAFAQEHTSERLGPLSR